jgi:pimeloyl-ACP methyl ester carboxylesterase
MRTALISLIRSLFAVMLFASVAKAEAPASGGGNPRYISPSWATLHSRYYAPYAIQAAAAYGSVKSFEEALRQGRSGVGTALDAAQMPPELRKRARSLLQGWRYQFGSEAYLKCLDSDPHCLKQMQVEDRWKLAISKGPAFHVWAHMRGPQTPSGSCSEVSIAFRGTTGAKSDWVSNFHQGSKYFFDDYYRQLRRNYIPIMKRIAALPCYSETQIVSVGHSLGAGLAQMHALAHPANRPDLPRVAKVFSFNPSGVTGADLLDHRTMLQNAKGLEIDRVFQNGEVLTFFREHDQQFPASSLQGCDPFVRTVEYGLFQKAGAIDLHSMTGFARELVHLSDKYQVPPTPKDCTRYRAPTIDEHKHDLPPAEAVARAGGRSAAVVLAAANRIRRMNAYAQSNSHSTGFLVSTKMTGSTFKGTGTVSAGETRAIAKPQMRLSGASLQRGARGRQVRHEKVARIKLAAAS